MFKIQVKNSLTGSKSSNYWDDPLPDWFYNKCDENYSLLTFDCFDYSKLKKVLEKFKFEKIDESVVTAVSFENSASSESLRSENWWSESNKSAATIQFHYQEDFVKSFHLIYNFQEKPKKLIAELLKINFVQSEVKKNFINLISQGGTGFTLKKLEVKKNDLNLENNYGNDFISVDEKIKKFLQNDETGLCILNGSPGTGKTTYIRHLISNIERKMIYVPPDMVNALSSPGFVTFLLDHPDSILIIEDAEEALTTREDNVRTQSVSNMLNLSDGILGDCLKLKIVCTFNINIEKIDPALLRKGRLKVEHEFKKLNVENSNKLLKILEKDYVTDSELSLAEIYNFDEDNLHKEKERKSMGFFHSN